MKIGIVLLGIILALAGLGLVAYRVDIGYSERILMRKTVLLNEVESMKEEGWEEVAIIPPKVLMVREGTDYDLVFLPQVESKKAEGWEVLEGHVIMGKSGEWWIGVPLEEVESMKREGWVEVFPNRNRDNTVVMALEREHYFSALLPEVESMKEEGWKQVVQEGQVLMAKEGAGYIGVSPDEVESMKEKGWEEVERVGDFYEGERVFMTKVGSQRYNIFIFPYQVVGAIVALIGFVTICIGIAIPSVQRVEQHD